jgi:hypothetical protein
VGLGNDAARDDFTVIAHGDLPGHEDKAVGDRCLAKGQVLPARTGFCAAYAFDGQETSSDKRPWSSAGHNLSKM